jgi:hypothetical protein
MLPPEKSYETTLESVNGDLNVEATSSVLPPAARQLGLDVLDRMAAVTFASGAVQELVDWATNSARSLVGPDRNEARMRLLARAIAATRAQMLCLEQLLGQRVNVRDVRGAELVDKILTSTTRRLAALLAEHRAACSAGQRAVVVGVGHAERVTIKAGP